MDDYYELGEHGRRITTSSHEAQLWFDRGLNWCYGFNHEEAVAPEGKADEIRAKAELAARRSAPGGKADHSLSAGR